MRARLTVVAALTGCLAARSAAGDPVLQVGGGATACVTRGCDVHSGSTVAEVTLPLTDHTLLVGHVSTTMMPRRLLTESQAIAGVALRRTMTRWLWVEAGAGFAAARLAIDTIGPGDFWTTLPAPAVVLGTGARLAPGIELAIHVGAALGDRVNQATLDVAVTGF